MQAQRNTLLVLLASLASATLAAASTDKSAWEDKNLQDWDKGWDVNIFGEPLDVNTACDGKPCVRFSLTKPVAPVTRETNFCTSPTGEKYLCSDVLKYIVVGDDYDDADDSGDDTPADSFCGTRSPDKHVVNPLH